MSKFQVHLIVTLDCDKSVSQHLAVKAFGRMADEWIGHVEAERREQGGLLRIMEYHEADETLKLLASTPKSEFGSQEMDRAKDLAWSILRADYYRDVQASVDDCKRAIKDGEITDSESLDTWLHESVDGSARVIYTARNMEVLLISENAGQYVEDFGTEGLVKDNDIDWAVMAYSALKRDIADALGAEGIDLNDPCPEPEDKEDEEEDDTDTEPVDGDLVTTDRRIFIEYGKNYTYVKGRVVPQVTVGEDEDWRVKVKEYQDQQQFWGNIWLERERGGWDMLDIETGNFVK